MIFKQKILSLEALRGIAALLVLLLHASQGMSIFTQQEAFKNFFAFGNRGVDLFFVLSGFIIFFVHCEDINHPERLGRYLWRRFARIYPTYWVACSLACLFYAWQGRIHEGEFNFRNILHSFLLFPFEAKRLLWVSWTLTFEILFYLLFGIAIFNKRMGQMLFALWACAIVIASFLRLQLPFPFEPLLASRNLEFFFGMLAAKCLMHLQLKFPLVLACLGSSLFLGFAIRDTGEVYSPSTEIQAWQLMDPLIYGVGGALLLMGMVSRELAQKMSISPVLIFLGSASYSIYLIHVPALLLFFKAVTLAPFLGETLLMVSSSAFALLMGILFYWGVEKPIRNFLSNRWAKYAMSRN